MNPVLMIFIDGVGIGKKNYQFNPFFKYGFKTFEKIFGEIPSLENQRLSKNGCYLFPVDANLGVEGLPQSGTGQVSIFCGMNAPKFIGKHFGPFPYSTTIPVINDSNILKSFIDANKKAFFANAYPQVFFNYLESGKSRLNVTALSAKLSGMRLNDVNDVIAGNALTAEITNERWNKNLNYKLDVMSPENAAERLLNIAEKNDFTLYEFFLTDHLGHNRIANEFNQIYSNIDNFLFTILSKINSSNLTLIVCSDHGNFEDLSVKTHTNNPALGISAGKHAEKFAEEIINLTNIKPTILKYCL
ncbi:MAG TPA: metalloenzyme [Ignavibacteriaceae bacterium]|jgi:phosphopentomutase|nr:MAG: phosphoglyceromutase [Ignavibacteria bacterium ADurb.Bin266]HQF42126.1 metalloenzyme [Ignavibacteriaceae bacterium]HQI41371.1 metalloenzyme [Ignavibacteriaceae bacterium]